MVNNPLISLISSRKRGISWEPKVPPPKPPPQEIVGPDSRPF